MKKKIAIVLATLLLVVGLSACGGMITSGEVIDKTYTPAHTQLMIIPVTISSGKSFTTVMVPYIYCYSDDWKITIQKYNCVKQEMSSATYRVTKDVYNSVTIGSEFVYDESYTPTAPEYTRQQQG